MPTETLVNLKTAMLDPDVAAGDLLKAAESEVEEGLGLYRIRYHGASRLIGISEHHLIVINIGTAVPAACRIGSDELDHTSHSGNVVVIPAGVGWKAEIPQSTEHVILSLPPARLAVAAAQSQARVAGIRPRLSSRDPHLVSIALEMTTFAGPAVADSLDWHRLADELLDHVSEMFCFDGRFRQTGHLTAEALTRLNAYLSDRLDQHLPIDSLADIAGQSQSHFPRLFRRTVGMSPHQYVMRLRLRRALSLIGRHVPLAEAAAASGFADQSHLNFWVRRIYGTTPGRLATREVGSVSAN